VEAFYEGYLSMLLYFLYINYWSEKKLNDKLELPNKGMQSDPKSLAAFGPGDARCYV